MSDRCKAIFERGRFFIESGSGKGFSLFLKDGEGIVKYIPFFIFRRIESLMNNGDKDAAVTLWLKACEVADKAPMIVFAKSLHLVIHLIEIAVLVTFLYTLFHVFH
jgi:hypothetical protein